MERFFIGARRLAFLSILSLIYGCFVPKSENIDFDGDGVTQAEGDCLAFNADVYPGALETCELPDADCDPNTQPVGPTVYIDADGDGFGLASDFKNDCLPHESYVGVPGDCNDGDGALNLDDEDGDGVTTCASDCNDQDERNFPGNVEICDGQDNNCNEQIDTDATDMNDYWPDADDDGYGDAFSKAVLACVLGDGYSDNRTDCNDIVTAINPGAPELCGNGLDDNCNGAADTDAVYRTVHRDADLDGFGLAGDTQSICVATPEGWTDEDSIFDCDDGDAANFPGNAEVCDNADNDCDLQSDLPVPTSAPIWWADGDDDGYGNMFAASPSCAQPDQTVPEGGDPDCDDSDASVNPGANEVCSNGSDDNCNGITDADAVVITWYPDEDEDGFGDTADSGLATCGAPPNGWVTDHQDCDDDDPLSNPNAPEICDNADNDCNGSADPPGTAGEQNWWTDGDGDGYGDELAVPTTACFAPADTADNADDCDDQDDTVNPLQAETCNDGLDNDCDGTANTCVPPASLSLSATQERFGSYPGDRAGTALATGGDVNGDGNQDIVVGSPQAGSTAGSVAVLCGPLVGSGLPMSSGCATITNSTSSDLLGSAVALGDVNDDGYDDVLVGVPGYDTANGSVGAVWVFFGDLGFGGALDLGSADLVVTGTNLDDLTGTAVAVVGDVTGDGISDFAVGSPGRDNAGYNAGAVSVFAGSATIGDTPVLDLSDAYATFTGVAASDHAGEVLAFVGDVDGDGADDLMAGAPDADANGLDDGAAYLFLGPLASGPQSLSQADLTVTGAVGGDAGGSAFTVGDFNGDSITDLTVGAPASDDGGADAGTAAVFLGPLGSGTTNINAADIRYFGVTVLDLAGATLATVEDTDGNAMDDLAVGAPGLQLSGTNAGKIYVILSPLTPGSYNLWTLPTAARALYTGEGAADQAGAALSTGHLNTDTYGDLAVGSPYNNSGGADSGAAHVIYGIGM